MRSLDSATLRALAAELDQEETGHRERCLCPLHKLLAEQCRSRAADYRTRAIKAEQTAPAGEPS